jgi:hypothetical protein
MQNVCRRLSDRLSGILVRLFLGELAAHSFSEFLHIVLSPPLSVRYAMHGKAVQVL